MFVLWFVWFCFLVVDRGLRRVEFRNWIVDKEGLRVEVWELVCFGYGRGEVFIWSFCLVSL